jgi:hypothetical protein
LEIVKAPFTETAEWIKGLDGGFCEVYGKGTAVKHI